MSAFPQSAENQIELLEPVGAGGSPELEISLPWPPSINHNGTWGNTVLLPSRDEMFARLQDHGWTGKDGLSFWKWLQGKSRVNRYLVGDAKAWREEAAWLLKATRVRFDSDQISCHLVFHAKTARLFDPDNFVKNVFDAMQLCGMIANDNQIADFRATRGNKTEKACVELRVWRLG